MSKSYDSLPYNIPKDQPGTTIGTEYGCRFPDGTYQWRQFTYQGAAKSFEDVATGDNTHYWEQMLKGRAEAANMPLAEYTAQHQLVKRTVILVTTAPEEV